MVEKTMTVGRPTKFSPEVVEKLIEAISVGATYQIACDYAGIKYCNFNRWMKRGLDEEYPEYCEFRQSIKKAGGKAAVGWLQVIQNAMVKEWTAAAWKIERRHFKDYSANPVVREEMKNLEKDIKKLKKKFGESHGKEAKEIHSEGDKAPGSAS
jgi:hypothetical protein